MPPKKKGPKKNPKEKAEEQKQKQQESSGKKTKRMTKTLRSIVKESRLRKIYPGAFTRRVRALADYLHREHDHPLDKEEKGTGSCRVSKEVGLGAALLANQYAAKVLALARVYARHSGRLGVQRKDVELAWSSMNRLV